MPWIFGYGSLIWRPDFKYEERLPCYVRGYVRRFWQASPDHRGTPAAPGRVVTLVPEAAAETWGIAYRIDEAAAREIFPQLDVREQAGYSLETLLLRVGDERREGPRALTYIGLAGNDAYTGGEAPTTIAQVIAASHGPSGSNRDYLHRLGRALREHDIADPHVFELETLVAELPSPGAQK